MDNRRPLYAPPRPTVGGLYISIVIVLGMLVLVWVLAYNSLKNKSNEGIKYMAARLPVPGSDANTWGTILNDFLEVAHNSDGTILPSALPTITAINGTTVANPAVAGAALTATTSSAASWLKPWIRPWQFDVTAYGAKGDGSTDDTAAFQAAVNAAVAYARNTSSGSSGYCEVLVPPAAVYYAINGALVTGGATKGNAQIALPIIPDTENKVTLVIKGVENASGLYHWNQTTQQLSGATLVSNGVFANGTAQGNSINANGNPCVIGGPTQPSPNNYGVAASPLPKFSNMLIVLQGIRIVTPFNISGFNYSAFDFSGVAEANIFDSAIDVSTTYANTWIGQNMGGAGFSIGGLMPANGNNDNSVIRNFSIGGGYVWGLFVTEHCDIHALRVTYCNIGLGIVGNYFGSVGASHAMKMTQVSVEGCSTLLSIIGSGQSGVGPIVDIDQLDTESAAPTFNDNNGGTGLANALGTIKLTGLYNVPNITVASPTGLRILNGQQKLGLVTAPTYTLGTAFQNPFWRDATVTLSGGTVTAVKQGVTQGGSVAPSMTTVWGSALSAPLTIRVPSGGWVEIDGSVKPTTNVWALD